MQANTIKQTIQIVTHEIKRIQVIENNGKHTQECDEVMYNRRLNRVVIIWIMQLVGC